MKPFRQFAAVLTLLLFFGVSGAECLVPNAQMSAADARIEVANPGEALRLDMYMDVAFDSQGGKGLAVPESAVQAIGDKQYVFLPVKDSEGSFAIRQVKLGPVSNGFLPVLDGLKLNDEVVTDGSFILKAEAVRQHPEL
jgi:membrane fusion protein, heavy metal efflux system